jgi:hypothetical protein
VTKTDLRLVSKPDAVADSIRRFSHDARRHRARAEGLLDETNYWVHHPSNQGVRVGQVRRLLVKGSARR